MRSHSTAALVASLLTALPPEPAAAQDVHPDSVYALDPITVQGRRDDLTGRVSSASVGYVGARDLRPRPLSRAGELLETVPGMILTQHSGSGKSNQMFVRGFNLDHGTDFLTRLEGMPVNLPTHAHGHGYTDLNFFIPELVDHIEYSLGNYYAEIGDFGSAGGADVRLRRALERPLFTVGIGQNGHRRIVGAASASLGVGSALLGGMELHGYDGPWDVPEGLRKLASMARYTRAGRTGSFSLLGMAYDNSWRASDQIPTRAVASGSIGRFGQIDPTLGGESSRYTVLANWSRSTTGSSQQLDVYGAYYDLDLFSNFTYLLDDPADGDQFRQQEHGRWIFGVDFAHREPLQLGGRPHRATVGAQVRGDLAELTLSRTRARVPVSSVRSDDVTQWSGGVHAQLESSWSEVFRTALGLRADAHRFDVASDLSANTGEAHDEIVSPKLALTFGPWSGTELYVSAGLGFHSNDARGTVATIDPATGSPTEPVDPLVRSRGAEVGLRTGGVQGLVSTVALWTIELDSELLFVGDAGTTEPRDGSRRVGVTVANFYRLDEGWSADLDLSLTRARLLHVTAGQDRIPGALENVIAAGLTYEPTGDGPFGSVRLRRFGAYPLIEDNSLRAEANALVNTNIGYRLGDARLTVSVLNVLDQKHSDIQYFYTSRLAGEPAGGVDDVHFHPAEPRQVRVALSWGM